VEVAKETFTGVISPTKGAISDDIKVSPTKKRKVVEKSSPTGPSGGLSVQEESAGITPVESDKGVSEKEKHGLHRDSQGFFTHPGIPDELFAKVFQNCFRSCVNTNCFTEISNMFASEGLRR